MKDENDYADDELKGMLLGYTPLRAAHYPRDYELEFRVWMSPEDQKWCQDIPLCIGDTSHTEWPDFQCDKAGEGDLTALGYQPNSRVPAARGLVCVVLGIRRELLEDCDIWPHDDNHLNLRRENIMVSPPGNDAVGARSLADLLGTVEKYGHYVRENLDHLFILTRSRECQTP